MRTKLTFLVALAIFVPMQAVAQPAFSTGGGMQSAPVWEQFELDPDKRIKMNFRNASIDSVIQLLARESGVTIVKDPKLTDKVTLITPKAVSLAEAFATLNAQLKLMNYELAKDESVMVIRARRQRDSGSGSFGGMTAEQIAGLMGGNRDNNVLKVYRIKYANASAVARVVNEVFMQQDQNSNPFAQMFSRGRGRGGRSSFSIGAQGGPQAGAAVRASSDDFSNSVIVNAPRDKQLEVEALIEEIDQQTEAPQTVRVYPLEYALAENVVPTIQTVMAANETTGRGGQSGNADFLSRIVRMQRGVTGGGSVVADVRTNSLIITATDQNHEILARVIGELDHDVPYLDTTFVFPLDNARAVDVAELLNQAFQQQRGGNRNSGRGTTQGSRSTRGGTQGGRGGDRGGGRGVEEGAEFIELELEDPDLDYGELLTSVTYRGGGGFGQAQGGATGRGSGGQVINVRQAQGQVTIIADPQTNSVIVVGDPENAEMIRRLLAQLDKIPEQVMIETIIVEATLDESMKLGVEWSMVNGNFLGNGGVTGLGETDFGLGNQNPPAQGFRYTITGGNFGGFLNALQTDEKFKVLSTPRIFTSNNVEAEINISQSVPFIVSQREDVNGNFIFNYSFQDVGIVLTVTPHITANGMVTLDVVQTANDLQGFTDFNAPIVNQRMARTTVSVMDGETIILGGIMRTQIRTTVRKIPILSEIPILGELFKSIDKREEKTELLVFLTPRVVRNPAEAEQLRKDTVDQLSDQSKAGYNKVRPPKTGGGDDKKTGNGNGN